MEQVGLEAFKVSMDDAVMVQSEPLRRQATALLTAAGVPAPDARTAADGLVSADLRGVESHGVSNMLNRYLRWLQDGHMNPTPDVEILRERPSTASLDCDRGLGLVVGPLAMDMAIDKARTTGMASIAMRNGRHIGMAAYTAMRALPHDMIGICTTAVGPRMYPTFGAGPKLGTNPLAVAVPTTLQAPFVYDASWTSVANNKIRLAQRLGSKLPPGLVADIDGTPIMEPHAVEDRHTSALLPLGSTRELGSHKGYGMACITEVLASLLGNSTFMARIGTGHANHFVGAIDIDAFVDVDTFKDSMDEFLADLRATPTAPGHDRVLVPGQIEAELEEQRRVEGIPLHPEVVTTIEGLCEELAVPFALDLPGEVD